LDLVDICSEVMSEWEELDVDKISSGDQETEEVLESDL
jgi:hypothetical protein